MFLLYMFNYAFSPIVTLWYQSPYRTYLYYLFKLLYDNQKYINQPQLKTWCILQVVK